MTKRKSFLGIIIGLATLGVAAYALAGVRINPLVSVDYPARTATGSLAGAHNSTDTISYIGCGVKQTGTSSEALSGYCNAKPSPTGSAVTCNMPPAALPSFAKVLGALPADSVITFTWDSSLTCTSLQVETSSMLYTKRPPP